MFVWQHLGSLSTLIWRKERLNITSDENKWVHSEVCLPFFLYNFLTLILPTHYSYATRTHAVTNREDCLKYVPSGSCNETTGMRTITRLNTI